MKLSIIIPYYKGEQYLRDCLAGIREGGYGDVEVMVCDDDPMDPRGTAFSRNRGLERCSGEYILFIDSDDYFLPGDIAAAMEVALKNPDSVTVTDLKGTFYCRDAVLRKTVPKPFFELDLPIAERVVGLIIPAGLIKGKNFPERLRYYSEMPFMAELIEKADFVHATGISYYKRIHNDPISFPSLMQEDSPVRLGQFCVSFEEAAGNAGVKGAQALAQCAGDHLAKSLMSDSEPAGLGQTSRVKAEDIPSLQKAIRCLDMGVIKNITDKGKRAILSALYDGNLKKARRIAKRILFKKKKKGLFGSKNQWRLAFYRKIALRMKVDKKLVFFESFNGDLCGDSPRYIYEKYLEINPAERKFVWSLKQKLPNKRKNTKYVKPGTLRYMLALARAGILVSNMRQPSWYVKRKEQFFFETWHGTPLKRLVFDMDEVYTASPGYKKIFYDQSRKWDYLLSGNPYSTEIFEHAFMLPKERIAQLGYPRNDRLNEGADDVLKKQLREKLGLPSDKKIVLYAPTWRDNRFKGSGDYEMTLPFDKGFASKVKDCFFIMRMHYFVSETDGLSEVFGENAVDMSGYDDINDLYLASDMLVTDYSSVFFDYAILGRPIVFYAYDEDEYKDELRGLYFDMERYCPGPVVRTQEELAKALNKDTDSYKPYLERYNLMGDFFRGPNDSKASERAVMFIEEKYNAK
ncbi:MAG: bifunctional glycosyltransferase family 2 protein/CDP-glycerol:glycerophosphate glycerophosphotransferase [Lachnospiraceae bacterium]|nr:bifunctional glycosyltransferase family 2 protein/CDP-glycerol:glycerophosphate glycerophosphotransferase [Lachnospiraceae bacterium]